MNRTPRPLAAAAMSAAPLLALLLARLAWSTDLPATVASHWSGSMPDGYSTTSTYFNIVLALAIVGALLGLAAARAPSMAPALPLATVLSASFASSWILSVALTVHAGDPQQARMGWWILVVFAAAAWGLAVYAVLPPTAAAPSSAPRLDRPLAPSERAVWTGSVHSHWMLALAAALFAGALTAALLGTLLIAGPLVLAAVLMGAISAVDVQVDTSGITLRSWGIRWKRIALARISSASAEELKPAQWGGWGYRLSSRGTAVLLRGGPGLVAHLSTGRAFAVSVDSPEGGAAVLNSLIDARSAAQS